MLIFFVIAQSKSGFPLGCSYLPSAAFLLVFRFPNTIVVYYSAIRRGEKENKKRIYITIKSSVKVSSYWVIRFSDRLSGRIFTFLIVDLQANQLKNAGKLSQFCKNMVNDLKESVKMFRIGRKFGKTKIPNDEMKQFSIRYLAVFAYFCRCVCCAQQLFTVLFTIFDRKLQFFF